MQIFDNYPDLINVDGLMEIFDYSRGTIYKMIDNGTFKGKKVGKKWFVNKETLKDFVSESFKDKA